MKRVLLAMVWLLAMPFLSGCVVIQKTERAMNAARDAYSVLHNIGEDVKKEADKIHREKTGLPLGSIRGRVSRDFDEAEIYVKVEF